ncbi:MAG: hypothetical protein M5U08_13305 [Burkholderiales bacterium]|nr:hypothetical protein [Burkholderiales bacterium]
MSVEDQRREPTGRGNERRAAQSRAQRVERRDRESAVERGPAGNGGKIDAHVPRGGRIGHQRGRAAHDLVRARRKMREHARELAGEER